MKLFCGRLYVLCCCFVALLVRCCLVVSCWSFVSWFRCVVVLSCCVVVLMCRCVVDVVLLLC